MLLTETTWPSTVALMVTMSVVNGSRRQTPAGVYLADKLRNLQQLLLKTLGFVERGDTTLRVAVPTFFEVVCGLAGKVKRRARVKQTVSLRKLWRLAR